MVQNRKAEHSAIFRGAAHDLVVLHTASVVGDGDDPRCRHGPDRGELPALGTDGDGAGRENIHGPHGSRTFLHPCDDAGMVCNGLRVGHGHDAGEPARCRRARAGFDGFLGALSGFAKVHVDIDQTGTDHQPTGIDFLGIRRG